MTRASFEAWKKHVDAREIALLGAPEFRRELVPVDEHGRELTGQAASTALFEESLADLATAGR